MPAPTNADELLDLIQKSNLVEAPRLGEYVQKLRDSGSLSTDPTRLAQMLVRDALLTFFQAEQLLQGKYKRFSLGKYKVLERLGSGGMGTVFLCEHKLMRRRVAVKVLPLPKAEDKASLDRFYREAKAAAAVDHPNIVRAYDIDQDENLHFLVMEWVDGTNLHELVKKTGPLSIQRACHYIFGAAVGLQHAHEIGLIHRDIKPGNILVDRSGVVKILDLGLARLTQDTEDNLTRQNDENVLGTADYLSPEQALDSHTVDIRADIYSLGATFYYLLSGSPPFPEGSVAQKLIWHQNRQPRPLKSLRADVPDELVNIVARMMAKRQEQRYQTPGEVMEALSPWVAVPIPPPAESELPPLSPVVAGGMGGMRQPTTSIAAHSSSTGGTARVVHSGGVPSFAATPTTNSITVPVPSTFQPQRETEPAVWSMLNSNSPPPTRGEKERPNPTPETAVSERTTRQRRRTASDTSRKKKIIIASAVGLLLLVGGGIGGYFAFINKKAEPPGPPSNQGQPRRITVTKAGGENTAATLREALLMARSGDTVVIAEARLSEPTLTLNKTRHKDLTIESGLPNNMPAVIEFAGLKDGVMLEAHSIDGLRIRNVEFDGKEQAERAVLISGFAFGNTIEDVTVRRVLNAPFYLVNATGEPARPITFDRVRTVLTRSCVGGIVADASATLDSKYITIRRCRFEGPGGAGVRFEGSTMDIELMNNRFYELDTGITFAQPGTRNSKGSFTNNTFYLTQAGIAFEGAVPQNVRYDFKFALNYFARTPALMRAQAPPLGLSSENNIHDAFSFPGTPPLTSTRMESPNLPPPKTDEDATFLRFPANTAPTVGSSKVGAQ